ncbi:hypothetical protein ACH4YN_33280 [Streptomyces griseofuscus]|uniref:hypothetical protein n=1 Tax=Streptomyces griseofuscus TaxID=146922 RepID=UPI0037A11956
MTNRTPEVTGDIDEKDWPEALNRALERGRQLDAQIIREREETAAELGALVAKLGGEVVLTADELAAPHAVYMQPLDGGGFRLTLK